MRRQGAFDMCHQNLHKVLTDEQRKLYPKQVCSDWSAKEFFTFSAGSVLYQSSGRKLCKIQCLFDVQVVSLSTWKR